MLLFLVFLYFAKDLPSPSKINARLGSQTKFFDRTGQILLYEIQGKKNLTTIEFSEMPQRVKEATIAIEDRNFYKHGAFSSLSILRATFVNLFVKNSGIQGGSTITQQYVKNALLSPERTFSRKIKELILSIEIEQFYKKDDILKLYLNEIPYGSNAFGIQAAAKTFFEKDAKDLTLDESALLAGIPRAPTYYSPYGQHKDELIARQHLILDLMVEQGYISRDESAAAKKIDTIAKMPERPKFFANVLAPHFVLYVQEQLEEKYGTKLATEGGLTIITTLDMDKQKASEEAIAKNIKSVRAFGGSNAAMVSADPKNGQILSMVGSYDFNDRDFGAYNVAIADRQPGSSFKPFAYATAFTKNFGPGSTLYDVTTDFGGGYKPENYTDQTYGVQSMRSALSGSLNIPAVKTLYLAGVEDTLDTAHNMGVTTLREPAGHYGLSLVLGAGEVKLIDMVNAYQSFANGGMHHEQTPILKITDRKNKVLEEYKDKTPKRVLDPQVAYLITHILSDNGARAYIFGNLLNLNGRPGAVKTGTTENYRDAWTVGYTPSLVAGVWAGNNDNKSMSRAASAVSAPIWRDFMNKVLAGTAVEQFERPAGIKEITLDANTGRLPAPGAKTLRTDIFPSWYKPPNATDAKSAEIDKLSGKLATACTPPLAKETVYSSEIHAEIPPSDLAYVRWDPPVQELARKLGYKEGGNLPTDSDDLHKCDDVRPKVDLTVTGLDSDSFRVKAQVTSGTHTANKLEIFLDNQIISTQTINGSTSYQFDHTIGENGNHTFKAVVTDSALYSAEDSDSVSVSGGGSSFQNQKPNIGSTVNGVLVDFDWSSYSGASAYELWLKKKGGSYTKIVCADPSKSECKHGPLSGEYTWYVRAMSGATELGRTTETGFTAS